MKRALLAAASLLFAQGCLAGSPVIAFGYQPNTPTVKMQMPADYVAIPITIYGDDKDPLKRADDVEKMMRMVADKVKQYPDLTLKTGVISLATRGPSKSFTSGPSYSPSTAQLYVLGALKPENSVFGVMKRIYQIVASIQPLDKTSVSLGDTALGIDDPEKYRTQLLGAMAKLIVDTRKAMGINVAVEIQGLEHSVAVMQWNDREVVLFIDYKMTIQGKTS